MAVAHIANHEQLALHYSKGCQQRWSAAEVEGLKRKLISSLSPTSSSLITDWEVQHPCGLDQSSICLTDIHSHGVLVYTCFSYVA